MITHSTLISARLARLRPLALLGVLLIAACSRTTQYEAPPSTINTTADINAKALQRAINLQKMVGSAEAASYGIGANDVVEIKVFDNEPMSASTRVSGNGEINFPPLGKIRVQGLSEREVEKIIEDGLRGGYLPDPHVTVFVREIQARMFGIIGAVNLPGQYSSFGQMRLADLISKAGGLRPEVGDAAYIIRYVPAGQATAAAGSGMMTVANQDGDSSRTIKVDLDGLLLRGESEWNVALLPSDLVNIPTAGMVHITGPGVRKPGTYPLVRRMTLQQLVDVAEGLKFEADRELILVRTDENNAKEIYSVDYNELLDTRIEDIQLRSGDKVVVERTVPKMILAGAGRAMAEILRINLSANYRIDQEEQNNNNNE